MTIQQAFAVALEHHRAGRLPDAERLYRQILAQQPQHFDALNMLGVLAHQVGRNDVAMELLGKAVALSPDHPGHHSNFGEACRGAGLLDEAIVAYRRAIELNPHFPEAYNNLGNALESQGKLDEAINAFANAIALNPGIAAPHYNLGNVLRDKGQLEDAIASYRRAIALNPGHAKAHMNLGTAMKDKGHLDEAIAAYRQAMSVNAVQPNAVQFNSMLVEAHSNLLYTLPFHPDYDARAIFAESRRWSEQHAEPLKKFIPPHSNDRDPNRRLRIGYVSPDFRDHVVGRNLLPLFRHHDRRQFEIFCYAQMPKSDAITREFQRHADHWCSIVGRTDEQVADQIRSDGIDILVDLSLHMGHNRLLVFARKPAPVQVTFAGYPGTTGLSTIDYRLSDPYLDPPGMDESVYSEKTVRLPHSFWCYDADDVGSDDVVGDSASNCADICVNALPAIESGHVTFGCLNNFCKINRPMLEVWAQVLLQVAGSRLLVLAQDGGHRQEMTAFLSERGVEPKRVEFVDKQPRRAYMELYHRIDIGLDSFPYNGHTTSLDSFWMGVPVVTRVGQTVASRAGWCQLSNLGLTELAGHTPEEFVRIAVALASDLPRLAEMRQTLRARMQASPLMDGAGFARNIEAAFRQIWRDW